MSSGGGLKPPASGLTSPAGTYWGWDGPDWSSPSPRLSRNWMSKATISTFDRLDPSCASQDDQSSRPPTPLLRPSLRWLARDSAWFPNSLTSQKLGLSPHFP